MKSFIILYITLSSQYLLALRANKVWFDFLNGKYRIRIQYTLPELKEFREVDFETTNFKKANAFYWKVLRGGEFNLGDPEAIEFPEPPTKPEPW